MSLLTFDEINGLFAVLSAKNPEPKTELNAINGYTLLVAVVLSAQSTDKGVNKATAPLFKNITTPEAMLKLGEAKLRAAISSIGLYKGKAKNVIALSAQLIEKHQSDVPDSREALEALPGVGRKTANVILNALFAHPVMAVDTHIFRLGNRIGLARGKTPLEVEKGLVKNIPDRWMLHAHHWLILLGRYICKARKPLCSKCPIVQFCKYDKKAL